ncbi:MAG: TRZ/ATZ family hydrolase [Burkholderiales bacterium]|jgi:5-methylthioadenosine/S-adenosylhomocysteine deaminase|nr:TRZ/ATZ family hydrolase [Burkholderiales bacterium]
MSEEVDLLIEARWVVPVEPAGTVLADHALAVRGGRIVALAPVAESRRAYSAKETIALRNHVLIPGLVNLHTHAAMALMRGLADDMPLMTWLHDHIWPAEAKHVSPEFVYDGTLLAAAEMLRGGITCANDMYFYPEAAGRAFLDAGMRAALGLIAVEFPTRYAGDPEAYLAKGLATRDALRHETRLSFCMAPHAPYTVSDRTFTRLATLAEELDLPIHLHLHETADEVARSFDEHGARPIDRLRALGLLSPRLIAVHAVHLTDDEIGKLADHGCSVAHCPSSNLKLASGFARVAAMLDRGLNVGLGTDGAASNNRLDLFTEARTAALLAKAVAGRADALPAAEALRVATLGGARALGLDATIGSLVPGKAADLCAVSLGRLELSPCFDPVSHLVYAGSRDDVTHVWVDGELVVSERQLVKVDGSTLENRIFLWHNALIEQRSPDF